MGAGSGQGGGGTRGEGDEKSTRTAARVSWREHVLTRASEIEHLRTWFEESPDAAANADEPQPEAGMQIKRACLAAAVDSHLAVACEAARGSSKGNRLTRMFRGLITGITGAEVERATSQLAAAEAALLRLAPASYVCGQLPTVRAHVEAHLPETDPRRRQLERILVGRDAKQELRRCDREAIVSAVRGASAAARSELARVRSFRNLISATTVGLGVLAVLTVGLMSAHPDAVELCFEPGREAATAGGKAGGAEATARSGSAEQQVCAIGGTSGPSDVWVIMLAGLVAAAISSALAVRRIKGTSTPYSIPIALAVLKLPLGVLTAFAGLLFMRAAFVPGLSELDSSAQIVAWAFVFGFAQQVVTRVADEQGQNVLNRVGTPKEPEPAAAARS